LRTIMCMLTPNGFGFGEGDDFETKTVCGKLNRQFMVGAIRGADYLFIMSYYCQIDCRKMSSILFVEMK
jgi:hypothetical protein